MSHQFSYLAQNVSFNKLPTQDFEKFGKDFKHLNETACEAPFFSIPLLEENYETYLKDKSFDTKEELFTTLDKACYQDGNNAVNIQTRKFLIGIYSSIEELFEYDEHFGRSYTVWIHDPLWNGIQDNDYVVVHQHLGHWFINKLTGDDIDAEENESDSDFWEYVSHRRANSEDDDLKQYYLERDNL